MSLALRGHTSSYFAVACIVMFTVSFAGLVTAIRDEWRARAAFSLWNIGQAIFALFVAGVPR